MKYQNVLSDEQKALLCELSRQYAQIPVGDIPRITDTNTCATLLKLACDEFSEMEIEKIKELMIDDPLVFAMPMHIRAEDADIDFTKANHAIEQYSPLDTYFIWFRITDPLCPENGWMVVNIEWCSMFIDEFDRVRIAADLACLLHKTELDQCAQKTDAQVHRVHSIWLQINPQKECERTISKWAIGETKEISGSRVMTLEGLQNRTFEKNNESKVHAACATLVYLTARDESEWISNLKHIPDVCTNASAGASNRPQTDSMQIHSKYPKENCS